MSRLKNIGKILSGDMQAWKPVYRYSLAFQSAGWKVRIPVLAALTLWMALKCRLFIIHTAIPRFSAIFSGDDFHQMWCMVFIPILVLLGVFFLIITTSALAAGKPGGKPRRFSLLTGRPRTSFLIVGALVFIITAFIPTIIAEQFFNFEPVLRGSRFWPRDEFLYSAALTALALGIYYADINAPAGSAHWWTAPFFLLPFSYFNSFPILWWSFVAFWFPSRYWSLWRVPLTLATCCLPLLAYGGAQPIRDSTPRYGGRGLVNIYAGKDQICYEAARQPGKQEFFIACSSLLRHYKMEADGAWDYGRDVDLDFIFDEVSFDFDRNKAYIYNSIESYVQVLDLAEMAPVDRIPVPVDQFPVQTVHIHQAYDSDSGLLAVSSEAGTFFLMDVNARGIIRTGFFRTSEKVRQLMMDKKNRRLFVLFDQSLVVLDPDQGTILQSRALTGRAGGMEYEPKNEKVYISYPHLMKIEALRGGDLEFLQSYSAPLGVRKMRVDLAHDILISAAVSGSTEVRRLSTGGLLRRKWTVAWAHWIELFPEKEQAVITGGYSLAAIWKYPSSASIAPWYIRVEMSAERALAWAIRDIKWIRGYFEKVSVRKTPLPSLVKYSGRIVIVASQSEKISFLKTTLEIGGFDVASLDLESFMRRINEFGSADVYIFELADKKQDRDRAVELIHERFAKSKILFAVNSPRDCPDKNEGCVELSHNYKLSFLECLFCLDDDRITAASPDYP